MSEIEVIKLKTEWGCDHCHSPRAPIFVEMDYEEFYLCPKCARELTEKLQEVLKEAE